MAAIAVGATAGIVYVKASIAPEADRVASARTLWRQIDGRAADVCVELLYRDWDYGLNYYAGAPLPQCSAAPLRPLRAFQKMGEPPRLIPAPARAPSK